ncbi:tetratricopeptide repeat protein [Herpetosiphon giganteus]|uniref:tetratricopeptide repeat protein n=1 Tax=Herpetosiphon giganteus TaxID=2029754 RepID=UPI00195C5B89|nr:tetratricopeptide repeat protein [Herpetosiphon giganteus]MBM7843996.1 tetratricopeptide (TPR) repeat protein [Herpetosiphon giganteus]
MSTEAFQAGVAALKSGNKALARQHLMQVVEQDENNEQAWLYLAGALEDPQEMRISLENALHINPQSSRAKQGLEWLRKQHPAMFVEPTPAIAEAAPAATAPAYTGATLALADMPLSSNAIPDQPSAPGPAPMMQPAIVAQPSPVAVPALGEVPDILPCPRCGAQTRYAEQRCRQCGMNLTIKADRQAPSRAPAIIAAILSMLPALLWTLLAILIFVDVFQNYTDFQKQIKVIAPPGLSLPEAQQKLQDEKVAIMEEIFSASITPSLNAAVVFLLIGVFGIVMAIALMRRKKYGFWGTLIYNSIFAFSWLSLLFAVFRLESEITPLMQLLSQSFIIDPSMNASGNADPFFTMLKQILFAFASYYLIILVLLIFAWKSVSQQVVRFVPQFEELADGNGHFNRGVVYQKRGMWYLSMLEWERAVKLNPRDSTYRHALGLIYEQMKRPADALQQFEQALTEDPNNLRISQDRDRLVQTLRA